MIGRRGFITGLISLVAAPAIMRAGSLMPVKVMADAEALYGRGPMMAALLQEGHRAAHPVLLGMDDLIYDGRYIMPVPGWAFRQLVEASR